MAYAEVVRNDLKALEAAAASGDLATFQAAWESFHRFLKVHMAMEDNAMFALLDSRFDGAATKAGLYEEHTRDTELSAAVESALADRNVAALRAAFEVLASFHRAHLEHEETVMMPLVGKLPTGPQRAQIIASECMSHGIATGDFDFFVQHGIHSLSTVGSTANTAATATRVFAHALQSLCTVEQWKHYFPIVRDAMPGDIFAAINAEVGLDGPGLLATTSAAPAHTA
jgi:hypothetical protein